MLTATELGQLERAYRGVRVLSGYVDDAMRSRAEHSTSSGVLLGQLAQLRDVLADSDAHERDAFDRCAEQLLESFADRCGRRARGWLGFFPEEGVAHVEALAVPLAGIAPILLAWDTGIRTAPYLCASARNRPAIVALLAPRAAVLHRYDGGRLTELESLRIHPGEERGASAALLGELSARLVALSGTHCWILLGGDVTMVQDAISLFPVGLEPNVHRIGTVAPSAAHRHVAALAERGIHEAREERELALVTDLLERHAAGGHGIAGFATTLEALQQRAVDKVCFTGGFLELHPAWVEQLIRAAFEHGARAEYVAGAAAERLDAAGGVCGSLRYLPIHMWPPVAATVSYPPPQPGATRLGALR